ncbi:dynamin family protein [Campylobacter sp. MIT 21-1685]|uniref:dynamin family protein n=1 Tax=unclassified Campylobacter TaxID=2593542 RepID=UPI00224AD640|nr:MULTISPECIES: dynamin family protein [unclassified Campylobacter]MCX2682434.1 dynamin family protein [Campylobacter sp. MIT 21-1684]MCX2750853.1 dynamin family protein [Campylobacter sp. MIT 21-1682]MCX2806915.1 dynamin family protein [Campylobacter sp. MIT 21-1685]
MTLEVFLQQIWQDTLQFLDFEANFNDKNSLDLSEIAIILSADKNNYERYFLLKEFQNIFKKINLRVDIFGVQIAQICAINLLKIGLISQQELLKALQILQTVSNNTLVFHFIQNLEIQHSNKKELFVKNFKELDTINKELQKLTHNETTKIRLEKTLKKFRDLDFSIAITGVVNSGKSSLLNALLKEDFLGVSNIPETANLTLLKYGTSQRAKIYFWDKKEWQNILESAKFSAELHNFLDALSKQINIEEYIQEKSLIKESSLHELKEFSSAKNILSALIKKIEIEGDLEFLKNNICIVDTPGLDDIITQRELLTNEYLKESDFLIHLMNASQSLTQKDLEFLTNCLLNSRLSKFLIVLTKSDLLTQKDLEEVIVYTREKIKEAVENLNCNLVEKIDFLCVSAKKASEFYKGIADEEEFKRSGMKEFEEYLFNELYSSKKSTMAINSYKKELLLELKNILNDYEIRNKLIKENEHDSDKQNIKIVKEFQNQKEILKQAKKDIADSIANFENLENGVENLVLLLAKKLKERLLDELQYVKSKKQKVNSNRILHIIDITTKDGINDILRDIKFENLKRIEELRSTLSLKYEFLRDEFDNGFEDFKNQLTQNIDSLFNSEKFALLRLELCEIMQQKTELILLEKKLDEAVVCGFKKFEISKVLTQLQINKTFFDFLEQKLSHYEDTQKEKLKNLEQVLEKLKGANANLVLSYEENIKNIATLKQLEMELLNAN